MCAVGVCAEGRGRAALADCPGLACAAGPGVHPRVGFRWREAASASGMPVRGACWLCFRWRQRCAGDCRTGLAHISAVYYERLEQGRGPVPSAAVLAGITDALRLTADERDHIHTLAGQAPPAASGGDGDIDPGLEYVLRAVEETAPASITDDLSNVAAQNWLNLELFGEFNIACAPSSMPSPLLWPGALCWRCCCRSNCSTVL